MSARLVERCGLCRSTQLRTALYLGSSPPTCVMQPVDRPARPEVHYPLELLVCDDCTLAQLSVVVDEREMFPHDYPYASGNSRALHANFEDLAKQASERVDLRPNDLVVDIGANDGTLLSKFPVAYTVGVEPTWQGQKGDMDTVWQAFFSEDLAQQMVAEHGKAKIVTACNVMAHVGYPHDVMRGIDTLLADDGIFVAENHGLASVVNGQWDTIYHEHLRYWDAHTFDRLLDQHGLVPQHYKRISTHGGSFRMIASRGERFGDFAAEEYDFEGLAHNASVAREMIRRQAVEVAGIGATARATTIINYCGLDVEDVEFVCEVPGSEKIGHYIPGTRIPVVDESRLLETQQDAILFSWHMADTIVPKLREHGYEGKIIIPLPKMVFA